MRTSHIEIRKRIMAEADSISDEEFFASPAFGAYLSDIAEAVTQRYQRKIKVNTFFNPFPGAGLASTNNRKIEVNTGNYISMSLPVRRLKANSLVGFLAHEIAHILYTDFRIFNTYTNSLLAGRFYPKIPEVDSGSLEEIALNKLQAEFSEQNEDALRFIAHTSHDLLNIVEDFYVNARMCFDFPGKFKSGIRLNQVRLVDDCESISTSIKQDMNAYTIIRNLIFQYATCGEINNRDGYEGPYLDAFIACAQLIDECKNDDDAKMRCTASTKIMLILWEYIQPLIEKAKEEGFGAAEQEAEAGAITGASTPSGRGRPVPGTAYAAPGSADEDAKEEMEAFRQAVDYETTRIALVKTDEFDTGTCGGIFRNNAYTGTGYADCGADIERLLQSVAEERVNVKMEQELTEELQNESDRIIYGDMHKGIKVVINRMIEVPEELTTAYKRICQPLLLLSKRLQVQVLQALKDQIDGEKLTGLYTGRFEARTAFRDDGRHFSKTKLPVDHLDLAVALLVDESGSMDSLDRITTARAASIVIHDFCESLGIPVMVMGHTEEFDVELYSYAEFDSVDQKDRYRIMDMSARSGNRDGAALRFVAERLMTRNEENRILILISDGQPAADGGYYGTAAEADLRGIRLEYTRKGITMFAAAIGEDRDNIERIYKEGFLDITDLNLLPVNLVRLIQRYIRVA